MQKFEVPYIPFFLMAGYLKRGHLLRLVFFVLPSDNLQNEVQNWSPLKAFLSKKKTKESQKKRKSTVCTKPVLIPHLLCTYFRLGIDESFGLES